MSERTDWIEFVPMWDEVPDAPEITIEFVRPEPTSVSLGWSFSLILSTIVAFIGLAMGVLVAVIGVADGSVSLPGSDPLPSGLLVGVGVGFAFVESVVLVLSWRRARSR